MNNIYKQSKLIVLGTVVCFVACLAALMLFGTITYAAPGDVNSTQVCDSIGAGGDCSGAGGLKVNEIVAWVINVISWAVGVLAVIMIMLAGFKYVTSNGDSGKITSAKNTLIYAVIGLIVAALAQVLVQFVLKSVTTPPTSTQVQETPTSYMPARSVASAYYHIKSL
jgi:hypothetical protein